MEIWADFLPEASNGVGFQLIPAQGSGCNGHM